jgi:hypothetical protein
MDDETYMFHQTPAELCQELINRVPLDTGDTILEPFAGENNFYDRFPSGCPKEWAEIRRGRDYKDVSGSYDWVITNPPFRLEQTNGRRVNSFYFLVDYYTSENRARKGVAFLANDSCFSTLTPRRLDLLKDKGWFLTRVITCNVKKWRGRYFFIIFEKSPTALFSWVTGSF